MESSCLVTVVTVTLGERVEHHWLRLVLGWDCIMGLCSTKRIWTVLFFTLEYVEEMATQVWA